MTGKRSSQSVASRFLQSVIDNDDELQAQNPFSLPKGINIFTTLREQERIAQENHRKEMLSLPIHMKGTSVQRTTLSAATRHKIAMIGQKGDKLTEEQLHKENQRLGGVDAAWILKMTAGARRGGASAAFRSSRHDYIQTKRQMFFAQYGLSVKKNEMKSLEQLAKLEQQKIEQQEQAMEEDSHAFDQFLKDSAKEADKANKMAEKETKIKLEKQNEIKNSILKKQSIKSQIVRFEEELKEILTYRKFLFSIAPKRWQHEHASSIPDKNARRGSNTTNSSGSRTDFGREDDGSYSYFNSRPGTSNSVKSTNFGSNTSLDTLGADAFELSNEELDAEETPEIYFKRPEEVIVLLHDLEELNLCLIRNSQETEKAIEEMKEKRQKSENKIQEEIDFLTGVWGLAFGVQGSPLNSFQPPCLKIQRSFSIGQIEKMTRLCEKDEAQVAELKLSCSMYDMGKVSEEQEKEQEKLNNKVGDVYKAVIGDNAAGIETIQMLSSLESKMEHLFDLIEQLPAEAVESAEKARERERRLRNREQKAREQRAAAEKRVKKALERAQEVYKKKTGKKLVFRSDPPASRQAKRDKDDRLKREKESEQLAYFFS